MSINIQSDLKRKNGPKLRFCLQCDNNLYYLNIGMQRICPYCFQELPSSIRLEQVVTARLKAHNGDMT